MKGSKKELLSNIEHFEEFLSPERAARILKVLEGRSDRVTLILENLYDIGNINAIVRSAENFGVQNLHVIESQTVGKLRRTTRGAHQWVDMHKSPDISVCAQELKKAGYKIGVTSFSPESVPLDKLDWTHKWAFVLGREMNGCSEDAHNQADELVHIPTVGFSQSLNVAVAAAVLMAQAFFQREGQGNLTNKEKLELRANWVAKSLPPRMLEIFLKKRALDMGDPL